MARILVVDDEPTAREVVASMLVPDGHEVLEAGDGKQALLILRKKKIDLMLLDVLMPEMDGHEVLRELRALPAGRDLRVIIVTAAHEPAQIDEELALGVIDHIVKPFDASLLVAAVERALHAPSPELEERRRSLEIQAEVYGDIDRLRGTLSDPDA